MSSITPIRDPQTDHLLTPLNAAVIFIDYQPALIDSINSMSRARLINNVVAMGKLATGFRMPVILTTINGSTGNTIKMLRDVLQDIPTYDRTAVNAWEDKEFLAAVKAAGRRKLVIAALWTEACLSFPTLDALHEGYEVYVVADAVGGTSLLAHNLALRRLEQAGAVMISVAQLACELQRDWNRVETAPLMVEILSAAGAYFQDE